MSSSSDGMRSFGEFDSDMFAVRSGAGGSFLFFWACRIARDTETRMSVKREGGSGELSGGIF